MIKIRSIRLTIRSLLFSVSMVYRGSLHAVVLFGLNLPIAPNKLTEPAVIWKLGTYHEIFSGKYSSRQVPSGSDQPYGTTEASTTATTGQPSEFRQAGKASACDQETGSAGGNNGSDDPQKPSAGQDSGGLVAIICSRCQKVLDAQELKRIREEGMASTALCNRCLQGTKNKKRARQPQEQKGLDPVEPALCTRQFFMRAWPIWA